MRVNTYKQNKWGISVPVTTKIPNAIIMHYSYFKGGAIKTP
jgi:hypothetical protein